LWRKVWELFLQEFRLLLRSDGKILVLCINIDKFQNSEYQIIFTYPTFQAPWNMQITLMVAIDSWGSGRTTKD
jgi:hypothetical protein